MTMLQWLDQTTEQHNILANSQINAVLIDLMMYKSPELISTSFNLLHHNYTHKKALIDYLKDIQIIEDEHNMKILKDTVNIKKELQNMIDESENWWG
jgi:subtilase family serine protease